MNVGKKSVRSRRLVGKKHTRARKGRGENNETRCENGKGLGANWWTESAKWGYNRRELLESREKGREKITGLRDGRIRPWGMKCCVGEEGGHQFKGKSRGLAVGALIPCCAPAKKEPTEERTRPGGPREDAKGMKNFHVTPAQKKHASGDKKKEKV